MEMEDVDYLMILYYFFLAYQQEWILANFAVNHKTLNFTTQLSESYNSLRDFLIESTLKTEAFSGYDKYVMALPTSLDVEDLLDFEMSGKHDFQTFANEGYVKLKKEFVRCGERTFALPSFLSNGFNEIQTKLNKYKAIERSSGEQDIIFSDILYRFNSQEANADTKGRCRYDNNTFFYKLHDGTFQAINFGTRQETKFMLTLFKVLYQHWQKNQDEPLPKSEIRLRMKNDGVGSYITDKLIKDTIANIRQSKIKPSGLSKYVTISYNRKAEGYSLKISFQ